MGSTTTAGSDSEDSSESSTKGSIASMSATISQGFSMEVPSVATLQSIMGNAWHVDRDGDIEGYPQLLRRVSADLGCLPATSSFCNLPATSTTQPAPSCFSRPDPEEDELFIGQLFDRDVVTLSI